MHWWPQPIGHSVELWNQGRRQDSCPPWEHTWHHKNILSTGKWQIEHLAWWRQQLEHSEPKHTASEDRQYGHTKSIYGDFLLRSPINHSEPSLSLMNF